MCDSWPKYYIYNYLSTTSLRILPGQCHWQHSVRHKGCKSPLDGSSVVRVIHSPLGKKQKTPRIILMDALLYFGVVSYMSIAVHDNVIKWKHFLFHRSPVNSPHKDQWRGALMFSLICAWINGWVNNRAARDLRRHRAHYDVIVMVYFMVASLGLLLGYIHHVKQQELL